MRVVAAEWPNMQQLSSEHGMHDGRWRMYWRVKRVDFHAHVGEPLRQAMARRIGEARSGNLRPAGRAANWLVLDRAAR